ncbi:MAG: hypothetical protein E6J34_01130 [Chloroflexi bacterium]|nr:MAG: hypothetical protein E6J34_01130 [Chloroflexota bacterium]
METSLQGAHLMTDQLTPSLKVQQEASEDLAAKEHHIHLPNPSIWPLILSLAIFITTIGLLFIPDAPWLAVIGAPLILVCILGWGLEDPMGVSAHQATHSHQGPITKAEVQAALEQAREVAERVVTVSSTAWSAHPIRVEIENENENDGVTLALYGKVELEAQRQELEEAIQQVPYVAGVRNFIVAEDAILRMANVRLEKLLAQGKLAGARDLSILVENYILNLYGDVPKKEMKYTLEREMVGIPGVRVVVNHIGLDKEIPGNLGKTRNV